VQGLAAGTTYYFAIESIDAAALTSLLSNVAIATTAATDIIPQATVSDLAASAVVDGVALTSSAPGDDGSHGQASSVQLRCRTSPITVGTFATATLVSGVPPPRSAGSGEGFTATGLVAGITSWFALGSRDAEGNSSAMSNVVSAAPTAPTAGGGSSRDGGAWSSHHCGLGGGSEALTLGGLVAVLALRRRRYAE
jgi:hypothetical protein